MLATDPECPPRSYFVRFYYVDPDGPDIEHDEELEVESDAEPISEPEAIARARVIAEDRNRPGDEWSGWEVTRRDHMAYDYPYWEWKNTVVHRHDQEVDKEQFDRLKKGDKVEILMPTTVPVLTTKRPPPHWVTGRVSRRTTTRVHVTLVRVDGTELDMAYTRAEALRGMRLA